MKLHEHDEFPGALTGGRTEPAVSFPQQGFLQRPGHAHPVSVSVVARTRTARARGSKAARCRRRVQIDPTRVPRRSPHRIVQVRQDALERWPRTELERRSAFLVRKSIVPERQASHRRDEHLRPPACTPRRNGRRVQRSRGSRAVLLRRFVCRSRGACSKQSKRATPSQDQTIDETLSWLMTS